MLAAAEAHSALQVCHINHRVDNDYDQQPVDE